MHWTKALAMLMAVSVLAAPMPMSAGPAAASGFEDYAAREAQSGDLDQFTGGWHGVVITLIVVAAVVYLVLWIWEHEHGHHPAPPPDQPQPKA